MAAAEARWLLPTPVGPRIRTAISGGSFVARLLKVLMSNSLSYLLILYVSLRSPPWEHIHYTTPDFVLHVFCNFNVLALSNNVSWVIVWLDDPSLSGTHDNLTSLGAVVFRFDLNSSSDLHLFSLPFGIHPLETFILYTRCSVFTQN